MPAGQTDAVGKTRVHVTVYKEFYTGVPAHAEPVFHKFFFSFRHPYMYWNLPSLFDKIAWQKVNVLAVVYEIWNQAGKVNRLKPFNLFFFKPVEGDLTEERVTPKLQFLLIHFKFSFRNLMPPKPQVRASPIRAA